MKIEIDGFHIFVVTTTTVGWKQANIEAEVQHKQGYQKHFKRRVTDRKHKRRNRRLRIDVSGRGMWYFYQSSFHHTCYGGTWDGYLAHTEKQINDILKYYLEDPEWHDKKYGENAIVRWIQNIEREIEDKAECLLPYPDEEQCREPMRRYKDDLPPCDWSGRHDSRPKMLKDLHDKEIRDYLVGIPEIESDNYLDPRWDEEDMDNPFKRHMSPEDYQELLYMSVAQKESSHAYPSFHEPDVCVLDDPYAGSGLDIE